MAPQLALILCVFFIFFLFWIDREKNQGVSKAIWVPLIWMFFAGSRPLSQWLNLGSPGDYAEAVLEGSPLDRTLSIFLLIAGVMVLRVRAISWNAYITKNPWIWLFFIYGLLSLLWSDYPFVSFKRWVKALGTPLMVLIILSEERPYAAIGFVLKKLALVLLPLSVLFYKYYPALGRGYHPSSGEEMFTGVTTHKNQLGALCLILGIYFSWDLLFRRINKTEETNNNQNFIYFIIIPILIWVFYLANSATSSFCMFAALVIFFIARNPSMIRTPGNLILTGIFMFFVFLIMELAFDLTNTMIAMLGRKSDLTTRVPMWEDLLSMVKNPLLGFGYESFWLGERFKYMDQTWGITSQAHNGYLEMYLNLGIVGVCFVICWILSGIRKACRHLYAEYPVGVLRICLILVIVVYNWAEATFFGDHNLWLLFFWGIMDKEIGTKK